MKRNCAASFLSIFFFTCAASAFFSTSAMATEGPRMVFKQTTYDFQEVDEGEIIEHAFPVANPGNQPLQITKVKPG